MKLSSACFLIRRLYYTLNSDSLKLVYFAHFYSIVIYGIIFWGNQRDVNKPSILQNRVLRLVIGLGCRSSCTAWFKQLEILTVQCLYILSFVMFVICNLTLIFLYILQIQGRKIFINHRLNLHPYKGALLILPLRNLINCH
jgi:hypothetical protein